MVAGRLSALEIAREFMYTLIPIALAYNIAHFLTLLLIQGQAIIPLASDPFGRGWDLFGTAAYVTDIGIVTGKSLWFLSVGVVVAGHVLGVYLAHKVAMRLFRDPKLTLKSQDAYGGADGALHGGQPLDYRPTHCGLTRLDVHLAFPRSTPE